MTKKTPKISILVPCYNVEKYVGQCLDSIVNQTLKDIEIIAINDGSTDSTLDIIKSYADKDERIKIIDKQNEGYGKSMNRGLDAATGEYIGVVESDDWADKNMFQDLVEIADKYKVDVVKSDFYEYTTMNGEKNVKFNALPTSDCGRVINPKQNTEIFSCSPAIWSAIYRRDFLVKNDIRFLESAGASYQDTGFNFKVFFMADKAFLTDKAYLHYRCDNANSSVKSTGKIFCVCDEYAELDRYLAQYPEIKNFADKLIPYLKLNTYMWNMNRLTDDAQKQFLPRFQAEFTKHIQDGTFNKSHYSDKDYWHIMTRIFPDSTKYKYAKVFHNIIHPLWKTKVHKGVKTYRLFGVLVYKKRITL